jgi:hypothetical protein
MHQALRGGTTGMQARLGIAVTGLRQAADQVVVDFSDGSRAALAAWLLPPAARDGVLRERGNQMMHARYAPLRPAP